LSERTGITDERAREIAAALAQAEVEPQVASECNHVWMSNMKQGWKVCDRCGERRDINSGSAREHLAKYVESKKVR
jgi:hypothetical protein